MRTKYAVMEMDQQYEEDPALLSELTNLIFINEAETCQKFMRKLSKLEMNPLRESSITPKHTKTKTNIIDTNINTNTNTNTNTSSQADSSIISLSHDDNSSGYKVLDMMKCIQLVGVHLKEVTVLLDTMMFNFPNLIHINLSFNNLREIPALYIVCPKLRNLDISHNKVSSLDFVSDLTNLTQFRCQHNMIDSLSPLQSIVSLKELWISDNKVDWTQFLHLSACKVLRWLVKSNNPCDEKVKCNEFIYAILPSLEMIDTHYTKELNGQEESVDMRVMLTQARAQLKRDATTQSLPSLDTMSNASENSNEQHRRGRGERTSQSRLPRGSSAEMKGKKKTFTSKIRSISSEQDCDSDGPDDVSSSVEEVSALSVQSKSISLQDRQKASPSNRLTTSRKTQSIQSSRVAKPKEDMEKTNQKFKTLAKLNEDLDSMLINVQALKQQGDAALVSEPIVKKR